MPLTKEEVSREEHCLKPEQGEGMFQVLKAIADDDVTVSFQGLRRRTGFHQESLSRALSRLEGDGLVRRARGGYILTENGQALAHRWLSAPSTPRSIILQSYLPQEIVPKSLVQKLVGRWFGNLRWLGVKEEGEGATLKWMTERRGVEVVLRIRPCQVTVESDAQDALGMSEAFFAAQKIMGAIQRPKVFAGKLSYAISPPFTQAS